MRACLVAFAVLFSCGAPPVAVSYQGVEPLGEEQLARLLRESAAFWGVTPDALDGWAVAFTADEPRCNAHPASGCTRFASHAVDVQALDVHCLETAQLLHELGHVVHGDASHVGPWWNRAAEQQATFALVRGEGASAGCAASPYYTQAP